jgi:predicted ArsR family transcriptional regulator
MSSHDMENHQWSPRSAGERLLMALKMRGTLSAAALGGLLGTSAEAARQQLLKLAGQGLVRATSERKGVGRPEQSWSLTPEAMARFPDTHAALTVQLLDLVRSQLGEAALETVIAGREMLTAAAYEQAIPQEASLSQKVAVLAQLRSDEGYMAEWREEDDGTLLLMENHCPICAAATACQGFCRAELDVFRQVLGEGANVERNEHIVAGGRRCSYAIRPVLSDA